MANAYKHLRRNNEQEGRTVTFSQQLKDVLGVPNLEKIFDHLFDVGILTLRQCGNQQFAPSPNDDPSLVFKLLRVYGPTG